MKKPKLTRDERTWWREYCKALAEQHPGAVRRLLIYGSRARGDAGPESDLDVLLVVSNRAAKLKRRLRWIGYMLAAASTAVPSIFAYTEDEWGAPNRAVRLFGARSSRTRSRSYEPRDGTRRVASRPTVTARGAGSYG